MDYTLPVFVAKPTRGRCPVCGLVFRLDRSGRVPYHGVGFWRRRGCDGIGKESAAGEA